jgi:hypothetical protein
LLADVELEVPAGEDLTEGVLRLDVTSGGFVGLFGLGKRFRYQRGCLM